MAAEENTDTHIFLTDFIFNTAVVQPVHPSPINCAQLGFFLPESVGALQPAANLNGHWLRIQVC